MEGEILIRGVKCCYCKNRKVLGICRVFSFGENEEKSFISFFKRRKKDWAIVCM